MDNKFKNLVTVAVVVLLVFLAGFSALEKTNASFFSDFWRNLTPNFLKDDQNTQSQLNTSNSQPIYSSNVDYEQAVINAVDSGLKSVVSIAITKNVPILERCAFDPFGNNPEFENFFGGFGQFYTQCPSGKEQKRQIGGGSGFIVTENGLILTNKHVVSDAKANYTVIMTDGTKHEAEVLALDPLKDIAIIKISKTGLIPAKLADSASIKLGQTAIAIGNALGEFNNSVSVGVISGLARNIVASGRNVYENIEDLIQTDAAINPGNSGGPLLNLKGEVIGINVAVAEGAQGIGFAIPINQAKKAIESVIKTGRIQTAYIGVRYIMINEEAAESQNLPEKYGALVRGSEDGAAIIPGSPADKAGLRAEDIILEVNGVKLEKGKSLASEVSKYNVGDKLNLKVRRNASVLNVEVNLAERPSS